MALREMQACLSEVPFKTAQTNAETHGKWMENSWTMDGKWMEHEWRINGKWMQLNIMMNI